MLILRPNRFYLFRTLATAAVAGCLTARLVAQNTPLPNDLASPSSGNVVAPSNPVVVSGGPGSAPVIVPQGAANTPIAPASPAGPDIRDIHDPVLLTFWEQHGAQVIGGSLAAPLALALMLFFLLRKKPQPPLTPIEKARQELTAARALLVTGEDKAFAIAVSDVVRRYLENAYQMPAPERTTEEFLLEASRHAWLQGELTKLLRRFLGLCDLAKFAGQQFGAPEREQLLSSATEFVETAEKLRNPPPAKGDEEKTPPRRPSAERRKKPTTVSAR